MTKQSKALLEQNLINQLVGLGYQSVQITDSNALFTNLKQQLQRFNNITISNKEFETILNHLAKGNMFDKAKTLRGRFPVYQ